MDLRTTKRMRKCKAQRTCKSLDTWLHSAELTMATLVTTILWPRKEVNSTMWRFPKLKPMLWRNSLCLRQFSKSSRAFTLRCLPKHLVATLKSSESLVVKNVPSWLLDTTRSFSTVRSSLKITATIRCAISTKYWKRTEVPSATVQTWNSWIREWVSSKSKTNWRNTKNN